MSHIQRTLEAVWRMESARIIAYLARRVGDVGLAEDIAQDSFLVALEKWPHTGLPDNPAAWLMTVAKNRAIDHWRQQKRWQEKQTDVYAEQGDKVSQMTPHDDDILSLLFTACHPVLSPEARGALTLKVVGGLSTPEIARAYLVSETTLAQRIVRAKQTLRHKQVPFAMPEPEDMPERLDAVLEVIYLLFNEGYTATAGQQWTRPPLCQEALRLGRILSAHLPTTGEVQGLLALMEIQAARLPARHNAQGEPVLLMEQNRARWDHLLLNRGFQSLARARQWGPAALYTLQAEIAACHGRARCAEDTDWQAIVEGYDQLYLAYPSPVIALNRAVALSQAQSPEAGLEALSPLLHEETLQHYHLLPSVQGDFYFKLSRWTEAAEAFEKAAHLTQNDQEQKLLRQRAQQAYQKSQIVLGLLCLFCFVLMRLPVQACGLAYPAGASAALTEEDALMIWQPESQTQTLIRRSYFKSDQAHVGFIVPTPTQPTLDTVQDGLFTDLTAAIQPEVKTEWILSLVQAFVTPHFIGAQGGGRHAPDPEAVKVLEQKRVGPYQTRVLQARQSEALTAWLHTHHYPMRPALKAWLEPYIQAGWYFTVFQLAQTPDKHLALPAVRLRFQTERPYYPYTEPQDSPAQADRKMRLFLLSPEPMASLYDRLNPELYDNVAGSGHYYNALGVSEGRSLRLYQAPLPQNLYAQVQALGLRPEKQWLSAWLDLATARPHPESASDMLTLGAEAGKGPPELYFYPNLRGEAYTPRPKIGRTIFVPLDLMGLVLYIYLRLRQRKRKNKQEDV